MSNTKQKHPIAIFLLLFFLAILIVAAIEMICMITMPRWSENVASAIGRFTSATIFYIIFRRSFKLSHTFHGFLYIFPALLLALYWSTYYWVSGGEQISAMTSDKVWLGFALGVFNEVFLCGILIALLKQKYNNPYAIVIGSALIVSFLDIANFIGLGLSDFVLRFFFSLILAIVLGAVYLKTDDLISVIVVRALFDIVKQILPRGFIAPYYVWALFILLLLAEALYGLVIIKNLKAVHQ